MNLVVLSHLETVLCGKG